MSLGDSTQRFTDRVDAYVAARPGYPPGIATLLARELHLSAGAVAVDLGCGTGLSCVPFLEAGFTVVGVEPNDAMRGAGEKFLAQYEAFRAASGKAEATGLADASADLVFACQAAHWFDIPIARAEARRILRRPAWAALIWNDRASTGSPFAEGYEQLLLDFGVDYDKVRHRHDHVDNTVAPFFGHRDFREATLANPTRLDFPTLVSRLNSASYVPKPEAPAYAPMLQRLRSLYDAAERDGRVAMDYTTRVFYGEVRP